MQGNAKDRGIVPRIINDIFDRIEQADDNLEFTVRMSYLEIYCEVRGAGGAYRSGRG